MKLSNEAVKNKRKSSKKFKKTFEKKLDKLKKSWYNIKVAEKAGNKNWEDFLKRAWQAIKDMV